jgi:hypothetical protein
MQLKQPDFVMNVGDTWSSVVERGPQDVLTTLAVPGFSIRLADIG